MRNSGRATSATPQHKLAALALSYLRPDRSGYITAEEYERITGEELDEISTKGRQMIARLAAEYRCTIEVPPIERRVYFTKSK
jgi:hypothetical protein